MSYGNVLCIRYCTVKEIRIESTARSGTTRELGRGQGRHEMSEGPVRGEDNKRYVGQSYYRSTSTMRVP